MPPSSRPSSATGDTGSNGAKSVSFADTSGGASEPPAAASKPPPVTQPRNPHYAPRLDGNSTQQAVVVEERRAVAKGLAFVHRGTIELPCTELDKHVARGFASGSSQTVRECPLVEGGAGAKVYFAAAGGRSEEVSALLAGHDDAKNWADEVGWRPLHAACRHGHAACATLLVQAGAEVDCPADTGWTPLITAAYWGHPDCVRCLLKAGAALHFLGYGRHHDKRTAFGWADHAGNRVCASLIRAAEMRAPRQEPVLVTSGSAWHGLRLNNPGDPTEH
jgi:hypothetical protein